MLPRKKRPIWAGRVLANNSHVDWRLLNWWVSQELNWPHRAQSGLLDPTPYLTHPNGSKSPRVPLEGRSKRSIFLFLGGDSRTIETVTNKSVQDSMTTTSRHVCVGIRTVRGHGPFSSFPQLVVFLSLQKPQVLYGIRRLEDHPSRLCEMVGSHQERNIQPLRSCLIDLGASQ